MTWVAGVDGFKSRWCVVLHNTASYDLQVRVVDSFADLLDMREKPAVIAIDIPIGLPQYASAGGRACERGARKVLKSPRASSVFTAIGRGVLHCQSQAEANRASLEHGGLGVGAQAFGLAAKLREADAVMTPELQSVVHEVHPEVCFWALADQIPMRFGKKSLAGEKERCDVLIEAGFPEPFIREMGQLHSPKVGRDDFLDACAAAWTAGRILNGRSGRFPSDKDPDARGLDQAIWF